MKSLSPLYIVNQSVFPEMVLAARTLALFLILTNTWFNGISLDFSGINPLSEIIRVLNSPYAIQYGLVMTGAAILLFSGWIRLGAFLIGSTMLFANLLCPQCTSVAHLFTSSVLLIISFSNHITGSTLLRYQLVVLYLCAVFNKLIDPDWWQGHTIETMLVKKHEVSAYISLTKLFPDLLLSQVVGIAVMLLQLLIALFLILPGLTRLAMMAALLLHIPMTIMTGMTFGPFLPALVVSFTALTGWRRRLIVPKSTPSQIIGLFLLIDVNDQIRKDDPDQPTGTNRILPVPTRLKQWGAFPPFLYILLLTATATILFSRLWLLSVIIVTMFVLIEAPKLLHDLRGLRIVIKQGYKQRKRGYMDGHS